MRGRWSVLPVMAALAAGPALAQKSNGQRAGVAMTAESGGAKAGCVQWSYETRQGPTDRQPRRVTVVFSFRNICGREVNIELRSQTADLAQIVTRNGDVTIAPGQVYSPRNPFRNYIIFNPEGDRYLNFWVIQSDLRFNIRNGNILDMNRCNPGFKGGVKNSKRVYPPCPPHYTYQ